MCASWTDKHDVNFLIQKIEAAKKSNGRVTTFENTVFEDVVVVLHSSLKFVEEVPELEQTRILSGSIFTVGANGKIDKVKLLAEISKRESDYTRLAKQNFTVATSISVKHFEELQDAQVQGCRITFSRRMPRRFRETHKQAVSRQFRLMTKEIIQTGPGLNSHTPVRVTLRTKTAHEAALAAVDALTLLRGLWNYHINLRQGQTFPVPIPRRPINEILLGPVA